MITLCFCLDLTQHRSGFLELWLYFILKSGQHTSRYLAWTLQEASESVPGLVSDSHIVGCSALASEYSLLDPAGASVTQNEHRGRYNMYMQCSIHTQTHTQLLACHNSSGFFFFVMLIQQ